MEVSGILFEETTTTRRSTNSSSRCVIVFAYIVMSEFCKVFGKYFTNPVVGSVFQLFLLLLLFHFIARLDGKYRNIIGIKGLESIIVGSVAIDDQEWSNRSC